MSGKKTKILFIILMLIAIAVCLYFLSIYNNAFFKAAAELAVIILGVCIFIISSLISYRTRNLFMLLIAVGVFTGSIINVFALFTHEGFAIFEGFGQNATEQLRLVSSCLYAAGVFAAVFVIDRVITKKRLIAILISYSSVFIISLVLILILKVFPAAFTEESGYTLFRFIFGCVISGLALIAIIFYSARRKKLAFKNYIYIILFLSFFILSEVLFILPDFADGLPGFTGYLARFASIYFIYLFFVETSLKKPFAFILKNATGQDEKLQIIQTHDNLTGFLNKSTVFYEIEKQFAIAKRFKKPFSVIIIDMDNLGELNEKYGFAVGDNAIKHIAKIIKSSVRSVDIKGRCDGGKFIICPLEVEPVDAIEISQKIQNNLAKSLQDMDKSFAGMEISGGVSGMHISRSVEETILRTDSALSKSKELGKNRITLML